jgi:23S rRNA U2552 (ribose-2'-O)-methylase RlmE/FtsJ
MDSKTSASWIRRWAERLEKKRAEKRAKARSDMIDLTIEEEAKIFKKRINVLWLGSSPVTMASSGARAKILTAKP